MSFPGLCGRGAAGSTACLPGETAGSQRRAVLGQACTKVGLRSLLSARQGSSKALKLSAPTSSRGNQKTKLKFPKEMLFCLCSREDLWDMRSRSGLCCLHTLPESGLLQSSELFSFSEKIPTPPKAVQLFYLHTWIPSKMLRLPAVLALAPHSP